MPIIFSNGFNITSKEPIDSRLVMTKEEMLAVKKARMPDKYFCLCSDDGKIYVYDANAEIDPEFGRFRPADEEIEGNIDDIVRRLDDMNASLDEKQDKLTAGDGIIIEEDTEGRLIIKVDGSSPGPGPTPGDLARIAYTGNVNDLVQTAGDTLILECNI